MATFPSMTHEGKACGPHSDTRLAVSQSIRKNGWKPKELRGRTVERITLNRALRACESGKGGIVLLEGKRGTGKTLLLEDTARVAQRRGFTVLTGVADELCQQIPLAPLLQALGEPPWSRPDDIGPHNIGTVCSDNPWSALKEMSVELGRKAARGPLLIGLDDLQAADPTTLLALLTLPEQLLSEPVLWMFSRADEDNPSLDRVFDALVDTDAVRVELGPLSDHAVEQIVVDVLGAAPDQDLATLATGADGNPFLLTRLLEILRDEGVVQISAGQAVLTAISLPERISTIAQHYLCGLSPECRHLLEVAAVVGETFGVGDVAALMNTTTASVLPHLREAFRADVVRPTGQGATFRHHVVWRALVECIPQPVRGELRREMGEALLGRTGPVLRGSHNVVDGGRSSVSPALPTAANVLIAAGRVTDASALIRDTIAQPMSPAAESGLRCALALALMMAGHAAEAVTEADKVLSTPDLAVARRATAERVMLSSLVAGNEPARARQHAELVRERRQTDNPAFSVALATLAALEWADGNLATALGHAREAARTASTTEPSCAHSVLAYCLISLQEFDEAQTVLRSVRDDALLPSQTWHGALLTALRSQLLLRVGRQDDAVTEAAAALAMVETTQVRPCLALALSVLATVAVRTGQVHAKAHNVEYDGPECEVGVWPGLMQYGWAKLQMTEVRRGPDQVMQLLEHEYADLVTRPALFVGEPTAAPWIVGVALRTGRHRQAEAIVRVTEALTRDNPTFSAIKAGAIHARGLVDQDADALKEAIHAHRDPWALASAAEDLGVLLGTTDPDSAIDSLETASSGYLRIGATRDAARVRGRLRRLGVRFGIPRSHRTHTEPPASGWDRLTENQRAVAELVAQGLSNRQVAAQMFLSPHTIAFHLKNVFQQLGINSRVELARLAAQRCP